MKIVLATNNVGKLTEFKNLFAKLPIELVTQSAFDIQPAAETGLSFVENALLKARHAAALSDLPALADDSGLCVEALSGKPGIFSARFAKVNATAEENCAYLLQQMEKIPTEMRQATFVCAIVYVSHAEDPMPIICQGTWTGQILTECRGNKGFGYDPVFYIPEEGCTAAELPMSIKNQLSHRARAIAQLLDPLIALSKKLT